MTQNKKNILILTMFVLVVGMIVNGCFDKVFFEPVGNYVEEGVRGINQVPDQFNDVWKRRN